MKNLVFFMTVMLLSQTSFAAWNNPTNDQEEMQIINKYVLSQYPGYQIALSYRSDMDEEFGNEPSYKGSYVFFNMNNQVDPNDGGMDLAVILEKVTCSDNDTTLSDCDTYAIETQNRILVMYFGQWDGSYKRVGYSQSSMLAKGDGGMAAPLGDPLMPMSVNTKDNALEVLFLGGSNTKWSIGLSLKYRNVVGNGHGFYLVRKEDYSQSMDYSAEGVTTFSEETTTFDYENDIITTSTTTSYYNDNSDTASDTTTEVKQEKRYLDLKRFAQLDYSDFFTW